MSWLQRSSGQILHLLTLIPFALGLLLSDTIIGSKSLAYPDLGPLSFGNSASVLIRLPGLVAIRSGGVLRTPLLGGLVVGLNET